MNTMCKNLTLDQFLATVRQDLDNFKKWWEEKTAEGTILSEYDHQNQPIGDWFEQFMMWADDQPEV